MKSSRQQLSKSWSTDLLPPDGPAGYRKTVVRGVGELRLPPVREIEGGAHPGVAQGSGQSPVKERRGGAKVGDVVVSVEPGLQVHSGSEIVLPASPGPLHQDKQQPQQTSKQTTSSSHSLLINVENNQS